MFFDPDSQAQGGGDPDSALSGDVAAGPFDEGPDSLDLVLEAADMMAVFAAHRFARIDSWRRERLDDAARIGRGLTDVTERSMRLELAAVLRITEHAAQELFRLTDAVVHRYPAVLDSLARAAMTERHASILVDGLDELEPELVADVLPRALALAEAESVGAFRRHLRKLIDTARSATLAERHQRAVAARRLWVEPAADGMAYFGALVPAVEARAAFERITAMAKVISGHPEETRTLDQIRADAFCDLVIDGRTELHPEQARGIRASVSVTVPALALVGREGDAGDELPLVEGVGPIPIEQALELCGGAPAMMRILTHPETGMVLSVGRDRYEPPPSLRKLVKWRAERCMAPGCGIPASRCDIDHSVAWEHGGHTSLANLAPLCRGHHIVKHNGDWTVRQVDGSGGALEWLSPAGRRYVVQPERKVPVFRPVDDGTPAPF